MELFFRNAKLLRLDSAVQLFNNCQKHLPELSLEKNNLEHVESVGINNQPHYKNLFSDHLNSLNEAYLSAPRLLCPRLENTKYNTFTATQILYESFDTEGCLINAFLDTPTRNPIEGDRAPDEWARTLLLLGVNNLVALAQSDIPKHIINIVVVDSSALDLTIALSCVDLADVASSLKEKGIGITFVIDEDLEILKYKVREEIVLRSPLNLNGILLCKSPYVNPRLSLLESWLRSAEGISPDVAGFFGGEVDEINQSIQSLYNAIHNPTRKLIDKSDSLKRAVVTASGPSLDKAIPWLQKNQHQLFILSAGSSLGSLLRNGIVPAAACFLERQSVVYKDLSQLIEEGFDLSCITLFASMTLDPRVSALFKEVIWFHRPSSSALALFADEADSALIQSGPHSANAALETLLHMGVKSVLALGCDFSARVRSIPRADKAIGESPREFSIPFSGRDGSTVFSNPELIQASQHFALAVKAFDAKLFSTPDGIKFDLIKPELISLDALATGEYFFNGLEPGEINLPFSLKQDNQQHLLTEKLLKSKVALNSYIAEFKSLIDKSNNFSINLFRELNILFSKNEASLSSEQIYIKRLIHYPCFLSSQILYDASQSNWIEWKAICLSNFDKIYQIYSTFLDFQLKLIENDMKNPFDWDNIKTYL